MDFENFTSRSETNVELFIVISFDSLLKQPEEILELCSFSSPAEVTEHSSESEAAEESTEEEEWFEKRTSWDSDDESLSSSSSSFVFFRGETLVPKASSNSRLQLGLGFLSLIFLFLSLLFCCSLSFSLSMLLSISGSLLNKIRGDFGGRKERDDRMNHEPLIILTDQILFLRERTEVIVI